jgi:hypothetical protein
MFKKILLLTLAATAFRCSFILGTPMDRHIGKYLGLSLGSAAADSSNNGKNGVKAVEAEVPAFEWLADAALELKKVPFFVRGRARRNIESYATGKGREQICMATVAEARIHFSKAKRS